MGNFTCSSENKWPCGGCAEDADPGVSTGETSSIGSSGSGICKTGRDCRGAPEVVMRRFVGNSRLRHRTTSAVRVAICPNGAIFRRRWRASAACALLRNSSAVCKCKDRLRNFC
eukprot:4486632-Amphidinium_carterae.1